MSAVPVPVVYAILLLLPGLGIWRLLRRDRPVDAGLDLAAACAIGFALQGALLLVAFAVHLPLWTVGVAALAVGIAAFVAGEVPRGGWDLRAHGPFVAIGLLAAIGGWRLWTLGGDATYHVGRVRRLLALDRLDFAGMPELVDGSNHPGYYVPLPHALVAESSWLTGASPTEAYRASVITLALLATLVAGALVWSLLHDRGLAIAGSTIAAAAGLAGVREWSFLADPPSIATQLLWPVLVILAVAYWRERSRSALAAVAALSAALALTHVTYLPFALLVLAGAAVAGAIRARGVALRPSIALAGAVAVPFVVYGAAVFAAARGTSRRVGSGQRLADGLAKWERLDQIAHVGRFVIVHPRMLAGAGLLLVALAVAPFAGVLRRRETAWIAGGLAALVVACLVPPVPGALGKLVSVNQIRRLPFLELPWLLVVAGAAGMAAMLGRRAITAALVGGAVLGVAVPAHSTVETVLAVVVCIGAVGSLAWIPIRGLSLAPPRPWLAAAALVLPWGVAAAPDLARAVADPPPASSALPPSAVRAVRALPRFTVIASEPQVALLLTALTDAEVYAVPPGNT
ncbi:MAG: hypothetical protein QOE98_1207, partial [Gaiellaceae bacterium]|nr:hypothetical protein [Gaiellaceae bacterium]